MSSERLSRILEALIFCLVGGLASLSLVRYVSRSDLFFWVGNLALVAIAAWYFVRLKIRNRREAR